MSTFVGWLSEWDIVTFWIFNLGGHVNRTELESRIWGKTIASARTRGIISEQEAQFLINQSFRNLERKTGGMGRLISSQGFSNQEEP